MPRVAVRILHLEPDDDAGELTLLVARARLAAAEDLAGRFERAGAADVRVAAGLADGLSFGERVRALVAGMEPGSGLVLLGSGAVVLATDDDVRSLVSTAASGESRALTNNRYSSDVLAIGASSLLAGVPKLPTDNALPRWLEGAGVRVDELPDKVRLGFDIDSPIDLEVVRRHRGCPRALKTLWRSVSHRLSRAAEALDWLANIARDADAELLVAGRLSATTLGTLETQTACRIRAFVEERGLRASRQDVTIGGRWHRRLVADDAEYPVDPVDGPHGPGSILGLMLDRDGPRALGEIVHRLADGAFVDSRVLLAHRHGADKSTWPSAEDRFASDLLLGDRVQDPWLRELVQGAGPIPIGLGGHSLVGPGLAMALGLDR